MDIAYCVLLLMEISTSAATEGVEMKMVEHYAFDIDVYWEKVMMVSDGSSVSFSCRFSIGRLMFI